MKFIDKYGIEWDNYTDYFLDEYAAGIGLYNKRLANVVIGVLKCSASDLCWCEDIAKELQVDLLLVEAIKDVLSDSDMLDYGTSPRGGWITEKGKEQLRLLTAPVAQG